MGGPAAPAVPQPPEIPLFIIYQPRCQDGRAGAAGDENQYPVTGQAEDFRGVEQGSARFRETRLRIVADERVRRLTDADGAAGDGGLPEWLESILAVASSLTAKATRAAEFATMDLARV